MENVDYFIAIWNIWQTFGIFTDIWNILQTFGIFYRHLEYFTDIWNILQTFGIFYRHLVNFLLIFTGFGIMHIEKSGNPGFKTTWSGKFLSTKTKADLDDLTRWGPSVWVIPSARRSRCWRRCLRSVSKSGWACRLQREPARSSRILNRFFGGKIDLLIPNSIF
jgi:hypothetical protein